MRSWVIGLLLLSALPRLAAGGPRIAVEPEAFDFGEVRARRTLSKEFRLVNFGDAELQVVRISTSCGCTVVETGSRSIAAGESTRLRVELQTRDDRGRVVRSVLIETNDSERPRVTLELSATVVE